MISLEKAKELILAQVKEEMPSEDCDISSAWLRTLACDIYADLDVPGIDNSAMDGYAVKKDDLKEASRQHPVRLRLIGEIAAGADNEQNLQSGEAISIMTGAAIPPGADSVTPIEHTDLEGDYVNFYLEPKSGEHIRLAGDDISRGKRVLNKGAQLSAAHIGLLAACGKRKVPVIKQPLVGIIATGDELTEPGAPLKTNRIYNSNSYSLIAQTMSAGAKPVYLGIASDNKEGLAGIINKSRDCQILLTSGGVSMGKYDLVQEALCSLGFRRIFWKVAIKPGMPTLFGLWENRLVFGLPGNPVASMVTFEHFIRPLIYKMLGRKDTTDVFVQAIATEDIKNKPGRRKYLRVQLEYKKGNYYASATGAQGSGMLSSMLGADGLMIIPENVEYIMAGQEVKVRLLCKTVTGGGGII